MMRVNRTKQVALVALAAAVTAGVVGVRALGTGQSFLNLFDSNYQQELYATAQMPDNDDGTAATNLGGVAFAPNGDPWVSECNLGLSGTVLHRFDGASTNASNPHGTATLHPQTSGSPVSTAGGCGLTNNADGYIYSNSAIGISRLDASTGLAAAWPDAATGPRGPAGNSLGVTSDPHADGNGVHHVIYVGAACHPSLPGLLDILALPYESDCKIYDLNPATGVTATFADLGPTSALFVDGVYFDPTGTYLFATNRDQLGVNNYLTILRRPENSFPNTSNAQVLPSIAMASQPDGVVFHGGADKFVVTNDEEGQTMTKFKFPGDDYTAGPAVTPFANGGWRGDLVNVGLDHCVYATQGRAFLATDYGTRYDDGTPSTEDSLVRICARPGLEGFAPGPGVVETVTQGGGGGGTPHASVAGLVWFDANHDGIHQTDGTEPGLAGVAVTLGGAASGAAVSASDGSYAFAGLAAGAYTVSVPAVASGYGLSTAGSIAVTLNAADNRTGVDFGFAPGSLSGFAYLDNNPRNGVRDAAEAVVGNVPITLTLGSTTLSTTTAANGSYSFKLLASTDALHPYNVGAPSTTTAPLPLTGSVTRVTVSPLATALVAGGQVANLNFGYFPPELVKPTCTETSAATPKPFHGTMTFQDVGGGLVSLVITQNANFKATMPYPGGTVYNPPAAPSQVLTFNPPTTAPVAVYVARIDETKSASITVKATDVFGNVLSCDPVATTVTKLRHEQGTQTFTNIPASEHIVTIENGAPGLNALDVVVNNTEFRVRRLGDNERRVIDVGSAMRRGANNVIALVPRGRPGDSAVITIADQ
jgi:hypothetical protein